MAGRLFELHRDVDATGVSGVGVVANGIEFPDGACAMRWATGVASTAVYSSIADVEAIHGHGGLTRVVWVDSLCNDSGCGLAEQMHTHRDHELLALRSAGGVV